MKRADPREWFSGKIVARHIVQENRGQAHCLRKSWPGTLFNGGNRGQAHCLKPTENAPHPRSSRTIHPQISFAPARFDKQHRF